MQDPSGNVGAGFVPHIPWGCCQLQVVSFCTRESPVLSPCLELGCLKDGGAPAFARRPKSSCMDWEENVRGEGSCCPGPFLLWGEANCSLLSFPA